MAATTLTVPPAKLAGLKALLAGGATACIEFKVSGADGVTATSTLASTEQPELVAAMWTAAHSPLPTQPDPLAATRAACNALGAQAVLAREEAKLAAEEAALAARRAALVLARQAGSFPSPRATKPEAPARSAATPIIAEGTSPTPTAGRPKRAAAAAAEVVAAAAAAAEEADAAAAEEGEEDEEGEDVEECTPQPDSRSPAAPPAAKRAKRPPFETTIGGTICFNLHHLQSHTLCSLLAGKTVTKASLDAALVTERTWADVGKMLGASGSTATTKLWRTWAKWHPGQPMPIAPPGRGGGGAKGGGAGGSKVKIEKDAPPPPAEADAAAVNVGTLF